MGIFHEVRLPVAVNFRTVDKSPRNGQMPGRGLGVVRETLYEESLSPQSSKLALSDSDRCYSLVLIVNDPVHCNERS